MIGKNDDPKGIQRSIGANLGSTRDAPNFVEGTLVAGRYRLGKLVGRGGMGAVFSAEDTRPPRGVALKFLVESAVSDGSGLARFLNEAALIASLDHPNILHIIEIGDWENTKFIAMELAEGGSLRDLIARKGKPSPADAVELMSKIGDALSFAHKKGVIHRDLKPANILLSREGAPKLADFGLAKAHDTSDLSVLGQAMGTLGFMSQEQRVDAKSVDYQTDIYSWGATLYQLLTGKDPLAWDPEEVPTAYRHVVKRCLKEKQERYSSIQEAIDALKVVQRSPARTKDTASTGDGCYSCGNHNDTDARFCEGCGKALFGKCPRCDLEARLPVRFCRKCGCDVSRHKQAQQKVAEAVELTNRGDYLSALDRLEEAVNTYNDDEGIQNAAKKNRELIVRVQTLHTELDTLVKKKELEDAQSTIKKIRELVPNDQKARTVSLTLPELIKNRDFREHLEAARNFLTMDIDLAKAKASAHRANAINENDPEVLELLRKIVDLQSEEGSYNSLAVTILILAILALVIGCMIYSSYK
jgi:serine/threonine protein kinase